MTPRKAGPLARQITGILEPFRDCVRWDTPRLLVMKFTMAEGDAAIWVDVDERRRRLLVWTTLDVGCPARRRSAVLTAANRLMREVTNLQLVLRDDGDITCFAALELADMALTPLAFKALVDEVVDQADPIRHVLGAVRRRTLAPDDADTELRHVIRIYAWKRRHSDRTPAPALPPLPSQRARAPRYIQ